MARGSPYLYMELKEFVKSTIAQIIDAVDELNMMYEDKDAVINPATPYEMRKDAQAVETKQGIRSVADIEFDLTVSVDESKDTGGKVNVLACVIGGDVSQSHTEGNSSVSRVRFTVPVMLPARKVKDAARHVVL